MKRKALGAILIFLAVVLLAGCDRPEPKAAPAASARANAAFLQHYGEPPLPEQGTCYARVGYYPLAGEPGKVRPVPFFLFRENDQLARLLERLLENHWEFSPESGLHNPFPGGSRVVISGQAGDSVTLDLLFSGEGIGEEALGQMIAPLVETALQFEELERVFITVAGVPLAKMPADGFRRDPARIAPPGPPLPLMVVGSWAEGEENLEELLINFDRPVEVHELRLTDAAGREIKGDYYRAGFDMAVVVHPAEPGALREGTALRVAWRLEDRLGRSGSGEQEFALQRYDHKH
jgi:germination protein M